MSFFQLISRPTHLLALSLSGALLGAGLSLAQTGPSATPLAPVTFTPTTATTPLLVGGLVDAPHSYTLSELQALPSQEIKVNYFSGTGAAKKINTHTYRGALLLDVLKAAKPRFSSAAKNDSLRWFVRAAAADQYVTVFSWGELEPAFGHKGVLLAYQEDGHALPTGDGAVRLVVPGDSQGGRYVSNLTSLQVFRADY